MKAAMIGIGAGLLVGLLLLIVAYSTFPSYDHDPMKMLELRAACLKDSPNLFTTYCDRFAEEYSRIPKKQ